jgi:tRNA pseudouridine55 synthase
MMNSTKTPWEAVNGVLLLDKPRGLTSQQALAAVRRRLRAAKAGHGGTLDPLADGLLILCFGAATKFAQRHLDADKRYTAVLQLGVRTSTDDAEGEVLSRQAVDVSPAQIAAVLPRFVGTVMQTPPVYSALKRDGKPLYAYARAGQPIDVAARMVQIHAIDVVGLQDGRLTLDVFCGKGTYIRALARDIGDALGCGAHLAALTRTASAGFTLQQAISLETVQSLECDALRQRLLPPDALLQTVPRWDLDAAQAQRFLHGGRIPVANGGSAACLGGELRVYGPLAAGHTAQLLGLGVCDAGVLAPRRLLSADELPAVPPPAAHSRIDSFHQDATS